MIVLAMLGSIAIYYFQYRYFFPIFISDLRYPLASAFLVIGTGFLAGLTAYLFRLTWAQIISIIIDTGMQNGSLSYAVISGSLKEPDSLYSQIPSNAQILFTATPLVCVWIVWQLWTQCRQAVVKPWACTHSDDKCSPFMKVEKKD